MNIFAGYIIALDFGTRVPFKKKQEIRRLVTDRGGIASFIVTRKVSPTVCFPEPD